MTDKQPPPLAIPTLDQCADRIAWHERELRRLRKFRRDLEKFHAAGTDGDGNDNGESDRQGRLFDDANEKGA
jgi:hypothetical protein